MKSAALQTAIFTALAGDSTLTAMLSDNWGATAIFSDVPEVAEDENPDYYPFISFGQEVTSPFDDKQTTGGDAAIEINVWSQAGDYIEAKTVADRIHTVLHRQALTITGADHILTNFTTAEPSLDPDGITKRVLMLFAVLYQETE